MQAVLDDKKVLNYINHSPNPLMASTYGRLADVDCNKCWMVVLSLLWIVCLGFMMLADMLHWNVLIGTIPTFVGQSVLILFLTVSEVGGRLGRCQNNAD